MHATMQTLNAYPLTGSSCCQSRVTVSRHTRLQVNSVSSRVLHVPVNKGSRLDSCFAGKKLWTAGVGSARARRTSKPLAVQAKSYNSKPEIADRVVAALPYLIPLFDGLRYGKFFFLEFPGFQRLLLPFEPLIRLYFSFPFAGLIVFFAVYAGIVNNRNFSRYVRYNAMQAVLLDIILILPGVIEMVFRRPSDGFGLQLYISSYNTIWLFVFACVAYGVGSCMVGQTARLPLVGDAADQQVM